MGVSSKDGSDGSEGSEGKEGGKDHVIMPCDPFVQGPLPLHGTNIGNVCQLNALAKSPIAILAL